MPVIGRRGMLRGGALLAGAAAGAAVVAATPQTADAADGDPLLIGEPNAGTDTTTLTVGGGDGGAAPALALQNADGPSLRLQNLSHAWAGQLEVGEMAGTDLGPIVGVDVEDGLTTTYLVTGVDLANVATPFASPPSRVLDLRTAAGRNSILRRSSANALASDGKLRAGQWIDVAMVLTGADYHMAAAFGNLTVTRPAAAGHAVLYPPGVRPITSSLNFTAGQTVANAAFVGTEIVQEHHALRLFTTADAWFILDITGGVTRGSVQTPLAQAARQAGGREALVRRLRKAVAQMQR